MISRQQILSVPLHINYNILLWWTYGVVQYITVHTAHYIPHHTPPQYSIVYHTTPQDNAVLCGVSPRVVLIGAVILRHCEPLSDVYTAVWTDDASFTALA